MRFFQNRSNPQRRVRDTLIDVDLDEGRMGMSPDETARLAICRRSGREIGVYMNERDRVALINSLLRPGEWVLGLPNVDDKEKKTS